MIDGLWLGSQMLAWYWVWSTVITCQPGSINF